MSTHTQASPESPLRIGTLGAATITPTALIAPARRVDEARVDAVAARDPARAQRFARKHGIQRVHESYSALIDDPEIDAIYNPLPNSHHYAWTIRALEAGKHVLCEKPLASNADEAQRMTEVAERHGRILMEAFHWRYHPLAHRMKEIVESGRLGKVTHIEASLCIPMMLPGNIRYRYALGGGAMMDLGAYTCNMLRYLGGDEPQVVAAHATCSQPDVDRAMRVELTFPDGRTGAMRCSLFSRSLLRLSVRVVGESGQMNAFNPLAPHIYHRLTVRAPDSKTRESLRGEATYTGQLRAFVDAIDSGTPPPTDGRDGVANMRLIDAVYERAGLRRRGE